MKIAGLIYGPEVHYLDHLAPLCALLGIPLVLTDEKVAALGHAFYPDLEIIEWSPHEAADKVVAHFNTIFCSTPRVLFDEVFYFAQGFQNKRVKTIWCPHGNSDKGRHSRYMEALAEEELILTYGKRIEDFLKEKGVNVPTFCVGNYRFEYYKKHRKFYEELLPKKEKPLLLYAPTWQDRESNCSFPDIWSLLTNVPEHLSLVVKLHPHLHLQFPNEIEILKKEGVCFLDDFPPIYPLLAITDLYIGDMSSIGYDFLAFNRPMILLAPSELGKAGRIVGKEDYKKLFAICNEMLGSKVPNNTLYAETFNVKPLDIELITSN